MNNIIILLTLLFVNSIISQTKEIYIDSYQNSISKSEFETKEEATLYKTYTTDTLIVNVKSKTKLKGFLKMQTLGFLKSGLQINSSQIIDSTTTILIRWHPGDDKCQQTANAKTMRNNLIGFRDQVLKIKDWTPFFIYKTPDGLKKYEKAVTWQKDYKKTIEKLFFPLPVGCEGYVVIDPLGNFTVFRGEYHHDEIQNLVKNKIKKQRKRFRIENRKKTYP